jgi:uncharacterized protein with FMN-binding domain
MRRPAAAVVGVFLGSVLLIGAKVGTRAPMDLGAVVSETPDAPAPDASSASPAPDPSGRPSTSPRTRRSSGRPSESSKPDSGSDPADDGMRSGTFAGGTVQYKYGTLQITIVVSGGRITDVRANHHGNSRMSEEINAEALPKLRREALIAQSARIATVSGATYTSQSYRTSLQAAIDRAGG